MLDADGDTVFNTDDAGEVGANASSEPLSGGLDSVDLRVSISFLSQTELDVELGKRRCIGPPQFYIISVDLLASGFEQFSSSDCKILLGQNQELHRRLGWDSKV